ncbi:MAG: NfeD family protein [Methanomicrobiales archaeon]|jgi:membrane protein implicated in regulation of membrane protease activity|nr:NfeD family protein [Methanomicrobiales archaeon]
MDELTSGWITVLIGAILLGCEVFSPGIFLAVPGTVLVILGILMLLGIDIFSSGIGIITGIVSALVASIVTVWVYSRLTPGNQKPHSTSQDTLAGMHGIVTSPVIPTDISGKVRIDGQEWSARSIPEIEVLPLGTVVVVVSAQGVHVVVKPLEESN